MSELNDLLQQFQLSQSDLDIKCDEKIFLKLTQLISNLDITAVRLGLTKAEIKELNKSEYTSELKKLHMLWTWSKKDGQHAKYLALVKALIQGDDCAAAECVLKYVQANKLSHKASFSALLPADHSRECRYENWDKFSKEEKKSKIGDLIGERQNIEEKFGSLVLNILHSFKKKNVDVDDLKLYLQSSSGISFPTNANLKDVFLTLCPHYSSWFNIRIFRVIVNKFGSEDEQILVTEYEEELVPFLQHSIFEIPPKSYAPGHERASLVYLYLFLPDGDVPTGQDVADIQHNVSKLLGIPDGILQFISYKDGSVILIFAVPEVLLCMDIPQCCLKKHIIPRSSKHTYMLNVDVACIL